MTWKCDANHIEMLTGLAQAVLTATITYYFEATNPAERHKTYFMENEMLIPVVLAGIFTLLAVVGVATKKGFMPAWAISSSEAWS